MKKNFPSPSQEDKDMLVMSAEDFSMMIEEKALVEGITCFEALMAMVESDEVGIDNIPTLLSPRLKLKLESDAKSLNLLKKEAISKKTLL